MFKNKLQKTKKAVVVISLVFLFLVPIASGILFYAKPAHGQISEPILDADVARRIAQEAADKAYQATQSIWYMALAQSAFNAVNYFTNKIAYDLAVAIATASPGQTPTFFTQDWGSYLTDTAKNSAGEFIGSLSDVWSSTEATGVCAGTGAECKHDFECGKIAGSCEKDDDCSTASAPGGKCDLVSKQCIATCVKETTADIVKLDEIEKWTGMSLRNLCVPPDPHVRLDIMFGLAGGVQPPTPSCEWSNIEQQWDTFISEASTTEVLNRVGLQFRPGSGSDLSVAFQSHTIFNTQQAANQTAATANRQEGQGFKPLTEIIASDFFKSPAQTIKDNAMAAYNTKAATEEQRQQAVAQATSPGAVLGANAAELGISILRTFIDTLSSKLLNRVMQYGLVSLKDIANLFPGESVLGSPEFAGLAGRKTAEVSYGDFITPRPQEVSQYNPLAELSACPQGTAKSPENCAIDAQFAQAINQATMGDPLIVSDPTGKNGALEKGLLHADWPLVPPAPGKNDDPSCFRSGYCYSNLVKLRKARLIPIGWEIAASSSNGTNTLGEAIKNFENCNAQGEADSSHPWCHLIDPSWLLKSPSFQCLARVYGEVASDGGTRQETCVDAPSCIAEDNKGNCVGGYGYCVQEKNVWRLSGDQCDAQFDSCRALRSRTGDAKSFMINTVDYGPPCNSDDVGCRWYSTRQAKVGDSWIWQDSESGAPAKKVDRIYFNKNVTQCDEAGCSRFYGTSRDTSLNLLQNSGFETFIGTPTVDDPSTLETVAHWSHTINNVAHGQATAINAYEGATALQLTESIFQFVNLNYPPAGKPLLYLFTPGIARVQTRPKLWPLSFRLRRLV